MVTSSGIHLATQMGPLVLIGISALFWGVDRLTFKNRGHQRIPDVFCWGLTPRGWPSIDSHETPLGWGVALRMLKPFLPIWVLWPCCGGTCGVQAGRIWKGMNDLGVWLWWSAVCKEMCYFVSGRNLRVARATSHLYWIYYIYWI